ncbi:hypothetical protein WJ95_19680 [Burkholderia ubonensis]|nr:hypothetical protein WJ95_19680 [Burkholderia ubonensis]KWC66631.1 hypothetical protein WL54_04260 [Burkholderia ubonensis]
MMILRRKYMVFCYPYFMPTSITPVDACVRSLCARITQSIEIAVLALVQITGVFIKRHVSPRFAIIDSHLCLLLRCWRIYFFFALIMPCFTATDLSAMVRPADECPFGNCFPASFSSLDVGGFMDSFLITIIAPRWIVTSLLLK